MLRTTNTYHFVLWGCPRHAIMPEWVCRLVHLGVLTCSPFEEGILHLCIGVCCHSTRVMRACSMWGMPSRPSEYADWCFWLYLLVSF